MQNRQILGLFHMQQLSHRTDLMGWTVPAPGIQVPLCGCCNATKRRPSTPSGQNQPGVIEAAEQGLVQQFVAHWSIGNDAQSHVKPFPLSRTAGLNIRRPISGL